MSLNAKQIIIAVLSAALVIILGFVILKERLNLQDEHKVVVKSNSKGCVKCHGSENKDGGPGRDPALVSQWHASVHAEQGVGCYDCHGVIEPSTEMDEILRNPRYLVKMSWDKKTGLKEIEPVMEDGKPIERPDIWKHEGAYIYTDVSPRTCARCHEREAQEFFDSRHASAAQFIGSVDNFLGRYAEGPAAANNGCQQCHGSFVRVSTPPKGEDPALYAADVWPNTGIGRVNADGSWGSCSACHSRHEFSAEVARRPDNCGKCHMGPDHPQVEVYYESKHGVAYRKNEHDLSMDQPGSEWILGKDYYQAPTCATCHIGAVAPHGNHTGMPVSHDVGARISWTLRPKVSNKPGKIVDAEGKVILKDAESRRDDMKQACTVCHSTKWVENFYVQYDQAVELYNNKYGKPLVAIYTYLKKEKIIDAIPMNEEMDYLFFEIWHHEGRRARHGASMMGPDYVQWHGFYELSKNFYTHFLPLAEELAHKAGKSHATKAYIDKVLRGEDGKDWDKYHKWTEGLSAEERKAMLDWEQEGYSKTQE